MKYIPENKLDSFIKTKKIKNILIVTGRKSFNNSKFKNLKIFKNFKSIMTIFYKKKNIPEIKELKLLIKKLNFTKPDLIIALGGGCVIDYAKLANGLHNIKKLKNKIKNNNIIINSKSTRILAIPTTAGSGAEVTKFSVIYINNVKYSVENDLLVPDFYSLIPRLVINSSRITRASSGFDAIAQSSESIFSKKSNIRSMDYCSQSLNFSIKNYISFVNNPNINNASYMLRAANLSGKAINISKTNAPHALSYFFTSKFKVPHGIAVSVFFIDIIKFYYFSINKKNNLNLIKKFDFFFRSINVKNILEFNGLFNKFLLESGIEKYLSQLIKKICKNKKINFYYNYKRLNNAPIKITSKDVNYFYLNKFNI